MALPFAGCSAVIEHSVHTYSEEWSMDGTGHWHQCVECNARVDYYEHSFTDWVIESVTSCTEPGIAYRVCKVCQYREEIDEPARGHEWEDEWTIDREANCSQEGEKSHHCAVCDERKDITIIPKNGVHLHTYTIHENEKTPDCTHSGGWDEVTYCEDCGNEVDREFHFVPALGHDWDTDWTIDKESTCTIHGEKSHHCLRCDERKDITTLPTNDKHNPGEATQMHYVDPTCTEDGGYDTVVICQDCGETLSSTHTTLPALGHTPGDIVTSNVIPATCTEPGGYDEDVYCEVCGEHLEHDHVDIPAKGHVPGQPQIRNLHDATCTEDGSYDETIYCTVCNEVLEDHHHVIPAKGHTAGEGVKTNVVEPKCTLPGSYDEEVYCSVCGEFMSSEHVVVPAKGHTWSSEWTIDVEPSCVTEGERSHHCLECEERTDIEPVPPVSGNHVHTHDVISNEIDPKCTETGSYFKEVYCDDCGELVSSETVIVPALGHNFTEWTEIAHPTAVSKGMMERTCLRCGHYETEELPVLVCHYEIVDDHIELIAENGEVQHDLTYEGHSFDSNGVMIADGEFFTLNGNTYYLVDNHIVTGFMVINETLYYFDEDGVMVTNTVIDDYDLTNDGSNDEVTFDSNGHGSLPDTSIIFIKDESYLIEGTHVYSKSNVTFKIIESDDDLVDRNNPLLANVHVSLTVRGQIYDGYTNEEGLVTINAAYGEASLSLELSGYKTRTDTLAINQPEFYFTYAIDLDVSNTLNGRVVVADNDQDFTNNQPLDNAELTLTRVGNYVEYIEPRTVTSNAEGRYTFENLTAGVYQIIVHKDGYKDIFDVVYINGGVTVTQNILMEAVSEENVELGSISGQVRDATKQTVTPIEGITLKFRSGINMTYGEVLYETTTDSNGNYSVDVDPGNYTIQAVDERENPGTRYSSTILVVKVLSNVTLTGQNIAMSPTVTGVRIVLTWGSTPNDLDSHTLFSDGKHIYYGNKSVSGYGNLDVDDTSAYGPETTTITGTSRSFTYYVYNYSNGGNYVLSNSGAVVKIYIGDAETGEEIQYTFNVPYGSGRYWNVFTYNASTGRLTFSNYISNSSPSTPY